MSDVLGRPVITLEDHIEAEIYRSPLDSMEPGQLAFNVHRAVRDYLASERPPAPPGRTSRFLLDVAMEADRQRTLMFPVADAQKSPTDWVWTLGSLVAKAVHRPERRSEHIIQAAALLANWHRHVTERGE